MASTGAAARRRVARARASCAGWARGARSVAQPLVDGIYTPIRRLSYCYDAALSRLERTQRSVSAGCAAPAPGPAARYQRRRCSPSSLCPRMEELVTTLAGRRRPGHGAQAARVAGASRGRRCARDGRAALRGRPGILAPGYSTARLVPISTRVATLWRRFVRPRRRCHLYVARRPHASTASVVVPRTEAGLLAERFSLSTPAGPRGHVLIPASWRHAQRGVLTRPTSAGARARDDLRAALGVNATAFSRACIAGRPRCRVPRRPLTSWSDRALRACPPRLRCRPPTAASASPTASLRRILCDRALAPPA